MNEIAFFKTELNKFLELQQLCLIWFQELGFVGELKAKSDILLRLHGAFMIGAWIGAASLGMMVARYFKQTWTGTQCCKKGGWKVHP